MIHCSVVILGRPINASCCVWNYKRSQTSCNGFRTLKRVWSQEPRNTSVIFHVMICALCLFHSGCIISLPWLFIGVFDTEFQATSPTAAYQSLKLPAAVRPAVANWIFRGFVTSQMAPGLSQSSVRLFGTHCLIDSLCDPAVESERFRRDLKTHLLVRH